MRNVLDRKEVSNRLEVLAKMVADGDETTIEIEEAREALDALEYLEVR